MSYNNFRKAKAIEASNKKRLLAMNPHLNDGSGIYFLTRREDGFKYAYIGQAKHILTRLAQHMAGYSQHIDMSLKKHKFFADDNMTGWHVNAMNYPESELDKREQYFIKEYANHGYQLLNKTSGSQGKGKEQIAEYKPAKGYRDGVQQGKKMLARELSDIISKHLEVSLKTEKQNNKISQRMFEKFNDLLDERNYENGKQENDEHDNS